MQISPLASAPVLTATTPAFRSPVRGEVALLDLHGVGFYSLRDTLTGYGRHEGYDSLANARRAAYMLSVGAESPAAGVYQQGSRFYVRALAGVNGRDPHSANSVEPKAGLGSPQLLHFEGNTDAHFAWVRDSRLVLMVDGSTKIWTKDAHHTPPAA